MTIVKTGVEAEAQDASDIPSLNVRNLKSIQSALKQVGAVFGTFSCHRFGLENTFILKALFSCNSLSTSNFTKFFTTGSEKPTNDEEFANAIDAGLSSLEARPVKPRGSRAILAAQVERIKKAIDNVYIFSNIFAELKIRAAHGGGVVLCQP